nr:MAG: hypothetical protein [Chemarfal virus 52]
MYITMAKQARKNRKSKKGGRKGGNKGGSGRVRMSRGMTPYQALIANPCDGPVQTAYGGEAGICQRFVLDTVLATTAPTVTCGYLSYSPAANAIFTATAAASSTLTVAGTSVGPGATFIGGNSAKFRPLAACVIVMPSAVSYTNITGEIATAVSASNAIENGVSYSVDNVFQICQHRCVLAKREYETKWFPGGLDHTYAKTNPAGTAALADSADQNSIIVAWRGWPAATPLSIRIVLVAEWTPVTTIGVAASSTPLAGQNHSAQVAAIHAANPGWWHNFVSGVKEDAGLAARYMSRMAIGAGTKVLQNKVMQYAGTYAPMLLTL